jgi:nitrogen fixation NifU-like protein
VEGKSEEEAAELFESVRKYLTEQQSDDGEVNMDRLGKLTVLGGVKEYPMRVKCATLAWHTLQAALEHREKPVTTE